MGSGVLPLAMTTRSSKPARCGVKKKCRAARPGDAGAVSRGAAPGGLPLCAAGRSDQADRAISTG